MVERFKTFDSYKTFKYELAGRPLVIETGKFAGLANANCIVRYGDTTVSVTVTASKQPRDGVDFFPLAVDYEEKLYSVGKIPGSFLKREGRPSEHAILASRMIDRPIRPLFPKDMRNDVVVSVMLLSVDGDNSPEVAGMIGTSVALSISDIPWNGPVGCVILGYVDGEYVINPTLAQREKSQMSVTVDGTADKIVMIEAGANQIPEDVMFEGIVYAHQEIKKLVEFIAGIQAEIGKPKFTYESTAVDETLYNDVMEYCKDQLRVALCHEDKEQRDIAISALTADVNEHFAEKYPDSAAAIGEALYKGQKSIVRSMIIKEHKRVDGRSLEEIRPLFGEVGLIPRVHGSGLFSRGQTQVLTIATLGMITDKQLLDGDTDKSQGGRWHGQTNEGQS